MLLRLRGMNLCRIARRYCVFPSAFFSAASISLGSEPSAREPLSSACDWSRRIPLSEYHQPHPGTSPVPTQIPKETTTQIQQSQRRVIIAFRRHLALHKTAREAASGSHNASSRTFCSIALFLGVFLPFLSCLVSPPQS